MATLSDKFIRRKDVVAHAQVCKDVPPKTMRPKVKRYRPNQAVTYQKVTLKIPDEYAFALMERYEGKGLQWAIMHHIKATINLKQEVCEYHIHSGFDYICAKCGEAITKL